jgi:hypothetical protein
LPRFWNRRPAQPSPPAPGLSPQVQRRQQVQQIREELKRAQRIAIYRNICILVGGSIVLIIMGLWLPFSGNEPARSVVDLLIVALFSGLVAFGELVSRYRDNPTRMIGAPPDAALSADQYRGRCRRAPYRAQTAHR